MKKNQIELDRPNEISNLYLRKDNDKFWQRWNTRFYNKTCKPSNIDGLTDDTAVANHFSDCFASVYFDSYENTGWPEKTSKMYVMSKHFTICLWIFT